MRKRTAASNLRPLALHASFAAGSVHHGVLRDDLTGVDMATSPDDAAAGQAHVPPEVGWEQGGIGRKKMNFNIYEGGHTMVKWLHGG